MRVLTYRKLTSFSFCLGLICMKPSDLVISEAYRGCNPHPALTWRSCLLPLFPIPSRHLDFFEMVRNEDDLELARRFDMVRSLQRQDNSSGS